MYVVCEFATPLMPVCAVCTGAEIRMMFAAVLTVTSPKPEIDTVPEQNVVFETTRCCTPGCTDWVKAAIVTVPPEAFVDWRQRHVVATSEHQP